MKNETNTVGRQYYYRPIKAFSGTVLKCAGFGAESPEHRSFYEPYFNDCKDADGRYYLPGVVILSGYRGDRIESVNGEWIEYLGAAPKEAVKFVSALDYARHLKAEKESGKNELEASEAAFQAAKPIGEQ